VLLLTLKTVSNKKEGNEQLDAVKNWWYDKGLLCEMEELCHIPLTGIWHTVLAGNVAAMFT
jgi:hypothetical protein